MSVLWRDAHGSGNGAEVVNTEQLHNAPPSTEVCTVGWLVADTPKCVKLVQDCFESGTMRNWIVIPREYIVTTKTYNCRLEND